MIANIETIDQHVALDGSQEMVTKITMRLPNNYSFSVPITPEIAEMIIGLSVQEVKSGDVFKALNTVLEERQEVEDYEAWRAAEAAEQPVEEAPQEQLIDWAALPDDSLAPQMKKLLAGLGTPAVLPASDLVTLVDNISERMLSEAEHRLPELGTVQRMHVARARTVPKDELGYPIVQAQVDRDPGEVALMGSDEDGVPQL